MPNNLQISAYIQCLQDRIRENIKINERKIGSSADAHINSLNAYLRDINNLEKFIRGEK